MANYDAVSGLRIPVVSSDPSTLSEGQLWYNTTVDKFRGYGLYQVNAAWSTAPSGLNAGRRACAGTGSIDDGIGFGGYIGGYPRYGGSETFNGSSWSNQPNLPTPLGQSICHVGTGSAAAGIAGYYFSGPSASVGSRHSKWNGSSWSTASSLPSTRYGLGGVGNGTDDYHVGGGAHANGGYFPQTTSWSWNGSSWSSEPAVNWTPGTAAETTAWGSSTNDWFATVGNTNRFFQYNGSSWSTHPATFGASTDGRSIWGSSNSATTTGGPGGPATTTQTWDGSSWSTSPATSNNNHSEALRGGGSAANSSGWIFGGGPGNGVSQGENFAGPVNSVQKVNLDFS
tara:strand:- start:133 stop:1155 length:1023 start_codon:yes stop_codon:yes gene_type:complete